MVKSNVKKPERNLPQSRNLDSKLRCDFIEFQLGKIVVVVAWLRSLISTWLYFVQVMEKMIFIIRISILLVASWLATLLGLLETRVIVASKVLKAKSWWVDSWWPNLDYYYFHFICLPKKWATISNFHILHLWDSSAYKSWHFSNWSSKKKKGWIFSTANHELNARLDNNNNVHKVLENDKKVSFYQKITFEFLR